MDTKRLHEILAATTIQLRKGAAVEQEQDALIEVTHIYAMPHESEAGNELEIVDLHFIKIGVDKAKAEKRRDEFTAILANWPDPQRLAAGPSYIEVGAVIGDQGAALCLFALGAALKLWGIITPATFGMTGAQADQAAGNGYVMMSGYEFPSTKDTTTRQAAA